MLTLLIALCLAPVGAADRYPRQDGVDALHYVFRLILADESEEISGHATVELRFVRAGVNEFTLDLMSLAEGRGLSVDSVLSTDGPVNFRHDADRLRVVLPAAPRAGERRAFRIRYHGMPGTGLRIGNNKYQERTFFSWNWPDKARTWLPIIDHPYDKATSEFVITAPAKYQVVANGLLQEEQDLADGKRLTHWKQSQPIASWLNAIGVAQFASRTFGNYRGIPLQWWVYHQDRDNGVLTFEEPTRQAIEFFSEKIGPYPYDKLANVAFIGGGGTEHASVIFYGDRSVTNRPATGLVAHEIAHQWWGNAVTERDWDDVWLSEGFATYFTHLFYEHYYGRDMLVTRMRNTRTTVLTAEKANPGRAVIHDNLADMRQVLSPSQLIYQKGGWVLHMLRAQIGTEVFWKGIREYYRVYRDANASTDELRQIMEEAAGTDLSWFFAQWLKRPQSPVLDGSWSYDAAGKRVIIELAQNQTGESYRLTVEVGITTNAAPPRGGGAPAPQTRVEKIELTQKQQRIEIASDTEPLDVVLDPNVWLLMEGTFVKR